MRHVFHRHGRPIRALPYEVWHAACAAANLGERRVPHDFRRTAAGSYRRKGVSEGVVMKVLGHKTRSIFERYNIKNEDDLRDAAAVVAAPELGPIGTRALKWCRSRTSPMVQHPEMKAEGEGFEPPRTYALPVFKCEGAASTTSSLVPAGPFSTRNCSRRFPA